VNKKEAKKTLIPVGFGAGGATPHGNQSFFGCFFFKKSNCFLSS
jgi:hypothetical protein